MNCSSSSNAKAAGSVSDAFDLTRIEQVAEHLGIGRSFHYFESVGSTNSFLREMSSEQSRGGALALANHQTTGRGRQGRRWSDKPGHALIFSLLLDAGESVERWPLLTLAAAVSVCRVLDSEGVRQVHIRWPNDVLIGERKVCGILTERALSPRALVLGVGLNVHQTAKDFPPALRQSAGSLRMAGDRPWSRQALLVAFLRDFAKAYELWRSDRFGAILAECRRRMSTLGRHVLLHVGAPAADSTARLSSPKPELVAGPPVVSHERTRQSESFHAVARRVEGTVMGLDDDGSLVLRETTGIVSRWHSGDVEVVRWTETKNA